MPSRCHGIKYLLNTRQGFLRSTSRHYYTLSEPNKILMADQLRQTWVLCVQYPEYPCTYTLVSWALYAHTQVVCIHYVQPTYATTPYTHIPKDPMVLFLVRSGRGWYRSLIINKTICMNTVVYSASTRAGRPCLAVVEYTGAHEGAGEMAPFCPLSLQAWGRSEGEDHSLCILHPD